MRAAWIEISLSAIKKNVSNLKAKTQDSVMLMGIIKADGYGHGSVQVAKVLREQNVGRFGVATVEEGLELRKNAATEPILILGYTIEEDYNQAVRYDLTLALYDYGQAQILDQCARAMGKKVKVHIKVDSGMGRLGYQPEEESIKEILKITQLKNLEVEGIFSHFAIADSPEDGYTEIQFKRFSGFLEMLKKAGVAFKTRHIANSAANIYFPQTHLDMVRPGIALYGQYPDAALAENPAIELFPAMTIKARLAHVKTVPKGSPLSYGCTFTTTKDTLVGTVPMGYADGIPRALSNQGEVLVKGVRCPIIGRVCMDQFMVDLSALGQAKVNDEIVFMGQSGDDRITADEIAAKVGTINYEIVTGMAGRLTRVYLD
ncbi:alanine racemase [Dethiosulfatarculus sandiegensis]|nr:alanine racemase [Dethiosulfatarculus sandiegensis]